MDQILEKGALPELVGQMMMVSFHGTETPTSLAKLIREGCVGGVILLRENCEHPDQLWELCHELQALATGAGWPPLLIAIDHEGGRVNRLPPPFTHFPAASQVGRTGSADLASRMGRAMARELRSVGINVNLAPVLDLHWAQADPVIGDRALHSSPQVVAEMGTALLRGMQENWVIAVAKHFPGHGRASGDTHHQHTTVDAPANELWQTDLLPFSKAINAGVEGVMTAHVCYTAWDASHPATLSPSIVEELLRRSLGFSGLVLTDDIQMAAISTRHSLPEAGLSALKAGADIVLLCTAPEHQWQVLKELRAAASSGEISAERLRASLTRILDCKARYELGTNLVSHGEMREIVGCTAHQQLRREIEGQAKAEQTAREEKQWRA